MQRPPERIGGIAAALLPAHAIARAIALPVAIALLYLVGKLLLAFLQGIQRLALRVHRGVGIAVAELAVGIAHRGLGITEAVAIVALLLAVVALLALLPLLAALALIHLAHAAPGEFLLQFLQPVAQALLVLLQIAHALIILLAVLAIAPRILALLEGLVAQLLLLADHVVEL